MTAPQPATPALDAAMTLIRDRTGLAPLPSVRKAFETSIRKAMNASGVADADRFAQRLDEDPEAFDALISDLTVGETYFFREPAHYDVLRRDILPSFARARGEGPLRIWSAGCATGEEPYSLAIFFEQNGMGEDVTILGTDISRAALHRARSAVYGPWSLRNSTPDFITQYFARRGEQFHLLPRLREQVEFAYLNLASDAYPSAIGLGGIDIIVCRNVLIYFEQQTVAAIAERFHAALREGGWLMTGPSDPPLWNLAPFETVLTSAGVFYRRAGKKPSIRTKLRASDTPPPTARPLEPAPPPKRLEPAPQAKAAPKADATDLLTQVRAAFDAGDFRRVLILSQLSEKDGDLCALRVRALANMGASHAAEAEAAAAIEFHPLSAELHYLRAMILLSIGSDADAEEMLRRVIYLDRSLAVAHLTLSSLCHRRGDHEQAARGYRTVVALCGDCPPNHVAPLSDGDLSARLASAARAHLEAMESGK